MKKSRKADMYGNVFVDCKSTTCSKCKSNECEYYEDDGRGDFHYHCKSCDKYWSVDGPDS